MFVLEETLKLLPAVIAVIGVLLGSFVTHRANFKTKSLELGHQLHKQHIDELRKVSADYLTAVNNAALSSLNEKDKYFEKLQKTNGLLAQIELLASSEAYLHAREMFDVLLNLYSQEPNKEKSGLLPKARSEFVASIKKELQTNA